MTTGSIENGAMLLATTLAGALDIGYDMKNRQYRAADHVPRKPDDSRSPPHATCCRDDRRRRLDLRVRAR